MPKSSNKLLLKLVASVFCLLGISQPTTTCQCKSRSIQIGKELTKKQNITDIQSGEQAFSPCKKGLLELNILWDQHLCVESATDFHRILISLNREGSIQAIDENAMHSYMNHERSIQSYKYTEFDVQQTGPEQCLFTATLIDTAKHHTTPTKVELTLAVKTDILQATGTGMVTEHTTIPCVAKFQISGRIRPNYFLSADGFAITKVPQDVRVIAQDSSVYDEEWRAVNTHGNLLAIIRVQPWDHAGSLAIGDTDTTLDGISVRRENIKMNWDNQSRTIVKESFETLDSIYEILRLPSELWIFDSWVWKLGQSSIVSTFLSKSDVLEDYKTLIENDCYLLHHNLITPIETRILRNAIVALSGKRIASKELDQLFRSDGDWYPVSSNRSLSKADSRCIEKILHYEQQLEQDIQIRRDIAQALTSLETFRRLRKFASQELSTRKFRLTQQSKEEDQVEVDLVDKKNPNLEVQLHYNHSEGFSIIEPG